MRTIRGKTALVTGAASGIGRAVAERLAGEGAHLYLIDIDDVGLAQSLAICRDYGVDVIGRRADVSDAREITATTLDVLGRWGGVDILVNNAGITYYGRTHKMANEHWDRVIDINLHAHLQFTRELLPSLIARPEAHVVNVCSIFGLVGMPKLSAYCVSKFGLVGFSEALRAEYGREGLGVTAMCPGFVDTSLFANAPLSVDTEAPKEPPQWMRTTAEHVARATIHAIRRNRRMVVVEPFARGLYTVKRFVPGLMDFVLHLGRRQRIRKKLSASPHELVDEPATLEISRPVDRPSEPPQRRAA